MTENEMLNYLRNGGSMDDLMREITQSANAAQRKFQAEEEEARRKAEEETKQRQNKATRIALASNAYTYICRFYPECAKALGFDGTADSPTIQAKSMDAAMDEVEKAVIETDKALSSCADVVMDFMNLLAGTPSSKTPVPPREKAVDKNKNTTFTIKNPTVNWNLVEDFLNIPPIKKENITKPKTMSENDFKNLLKKLNL